MLELKGLKIYKDSRGNPIGYDSNDLRDYLEKRGLLEKWKEWAMGITGMIIDGHFIIYASDVESFLGGKPNLD